MFKRNSAFFLILTVIFIFQVIWNESDAKIGMSHLIIMMASAVFMFLLEQIKTNKIVNQMITLIYFSFFLILICFYELLSGAVVPANKDYFFCYSIITAVIIGFFLSLYKLIKFQFFFKP